MGLEQCGQARKTELMHLGWNIFPQGSIMKAFSSPHSKQRWWVANSQGFHAI